MALARSTQPKHASPIFTPPKAADPHVEQLPPVKPAAASVLLPLREDIIITPGPRRADGSPGWVLQDPAANAFYHIGWREFEILSRWHLGDPEAILAATTDETTLAASPEHVSTVAAFLSAHGLLRPSAKKLTELHAKFKGHGPMGHISRLLGDLLFRKIPLVSPDAFLRRTMHLVRPLFSAGFLGVIGVLLLLALYLVGRQWGLFVSGFEHLYSLEGVIGTAIALTIAKSVHELAHAYAARLAGCDVPTMGVLLIMLWPVLYTETSASWRLPNRSKRLRIAIAGVAAELVLAVLALLAWCFLDTGWLRNTMQYAATSLVLLSVLVNANPLMRFDGYFVVCDLTRMENLQPRSLSMLGWAARKVMAGGSEASPEPSFGFGSKSALMAFGCALGLYRVSLYSGIAYTLASFVFPALGLLLAVLVVLSFLAWPVSREAVRWFQVARKRLGRVWGPLRVGAVLALLALPLIVPWRTTLMLPVVVKFGEAHTVFAPEPASIVRVLASDGSAVAAGAPLIEMDSPELRHKLDADRLKAERLTELLDQHMTQADYRQDEHVEEEEILRLKVEIAGLEARIAKLTLRAASAGIVRDVAPGLKPGAWVRDDLALLRIVDAGSTTAEAYVEERDLAYVLANANGTLWLDGNPFTHIPVRVRNLFDQAITRVDAPIIAGPGGGPVAVKQANDRTWTPETAIYKAILDLPGSGTLSGGRTLETRGFASIETLPRNLIGRIWDRIVGVWRREIG